MDILTLILCAIPIGILIALAPIAPIAMNAWRHGLETQRKIDMTEAKIKETNARRDALIAIAQAKTAEAQNKVVLSDQMIELRELQILEKKRSLGVNAPDFDPPNYSTTPTPDADAPTAPRDSS